ncbi:MAG: RNA 2',3'-cyclic phosphodiesterase [Candidatus Margulisiibacteriota bacterium]|nr:RNA 2',3'-cyclic phosphodiesterase [Candidatus Margulisiibacteriota bacterium]
MRAFISVELPDKVKEKIKEFIEEVIKELSDTEIKVKWVKKENLHLTLKFLGWVDDKALDKLIALTEKAVSNSGSFEVSLGGAGTFPEGKNPKVVWVGTDRGGDKLCDLADRLSKTGPRRETREFKAHLTIGRVKDKRGVDKLLKKLEKFKDIKFGEISVDRIFIMKSTLTPKGPIYEIFREVKV